MVSLRSPARVDPTTLANLASRFAIAVKALTSPVAPAHIRTVLALIADIEQIRNPDGHSFGQVGRNVGVGFSSATLEAMERFFQCVDEVLIQFELVGLCWTPYDAGFAKGLRIDPWMIDNAEQLANNDELIEAIGITSDGLGQIMKSAGPNQ